MRRRPPSTVLCLSALVFLAVPAAAQDAPAAKRAVIAETDRIAGEIARMASTLWRYSELANIADWTLNAGSRMVNTGSAYWLNLFISGTGSDYRVYSVQIIYHLP